MKNMHVVQGAQQYSSDRDQDATCRQVALGRPTSFRVAVACRLSELSVIWSKSISRSRPTPERSSMCAAWLPTPCGTRALALLGVECLLALG